jgi:hypothetical protein
MVSSSKDRLGLIVHTAVGNWRSPGQTGGGFVDVKGVSNVVDTMIPGNENEKGFAANRDITVFSTFENVLNYAALLYALAGHFDVEGEPLLKWEQVEKISGGNSKELRELAERLERLTPEQYVRLTDRFIALLPSEFVDKEGKRVLQWEQISGMLHGALLAGVRKQMATEGVTSSPRVLAYVDISMEERKVLGEKSAYEPTFAEVKSTPGLYGIQRMVAQVALWLSEKGVFSDRVKEAAERHLAQAKTVTTEITQTINAGTAGWRAAPITLNQVSVFAQSLAEAIKAGKYGDPSQVKILSAFDSRPQSPAGKGKQYQEDLEKSKRSVEDSRKDTDKNAKKAQESQRELERLKANQAKETAQITLETNKLKKTAR